MYVYIYTYGIIAGDPSARFHTRRRRQVGIPRPLEPRDLRDCTVGVSHVRGAPKKDRLYTVSMLSM